MIWPLGMVNTRRRLVRSLVTRSVTSSTVPSASLSVGPERQLHQIAEAVLLLGDDEEPGQQVLHDALGAETQCRAQHRRGCHQGATGIARMSVIWTNTMTQISAMVTHEMTDATA